MAGKKILLVDDDETMLKLFGDLLLSQGFEVISANNGTDGLRLAIEKIPDLIILDVMMPGKDGGEVGRELLDNIKTKNIPVIFLTSLVSEEETGKGGGKIAGRFYISKSSDKKELIKKIKEII
ncbi:MAG: response regulator [Candidatus Omnitrophota bacterium]|jgi:two-component system alkaline phosphatase synthesis response regulator PhoP